MAEGSYVFQISGIKKPEIKKCLIKGIRKLGGKYIGGSVYQHSSTHFIVPQVLPSEKFLAACAAGKWVVTPNYVLDSVKNGSWLPEELYEVAISTSTTSAFYPVRQWRERVASGTLKGAFQGWRVLLMVQEPARRAMFNRLLKAGRAKVFHYSPPSYASITHVMAKPITEDIKSHDAPCYPVSHIVQHLFGKRYLDINFNLSEDETENEESSFVATFSKFEKELKDHMIRQNRHPRLLYCEFQGYNDPHRPQSEGTEADFSQIATMIECGLFTEALDSIKSGLFPGLLPPAQCLVSLLEYAQQGNATTVFLRIFMQFLHRLVVTNPPWKAPKSVKKYFSKVFQCPCCKSGLWPFLESTICYCLLRDSTCHPLPGPALPTLLHFHSDLLAFVLKLFKGELHAITTTGIYLQQQVCENLQDSARGSLILGTFWTVWERSTLLSVAVKQLTQLLVEATSEDDSKKTEKQTEKQELVYMTGILVDLLSVVVEFWCQHNFKLNQALVEKGLKDYAEHFAVISHKLPPSLLAELIAEVPSSRLKMALADSVFRSLCCKNGFTVGDDPLCLKKIMLYLPALDILSQSQTLCNTEAGLTDCGLESTSDGVNDSGAEKGNILKGLKRVNAAGETLLHRACKRNQVETVLQILALPDTDVNVKDHAGWTPLHEACNHGSTACVQALLRHRPAPIVNSQVGGISPLYDALLNGHMDIAKLLLEHEGSVILQQKNHSGMTPLDLVLDSAQREELLDSALTGDRARKKKPTEVLNLPLLEAGSCLLLHLLTAYHQEKGLSMFTEAGAQSLGQRLVRALKMHSFETVTAAWMDQQAVRLLEDVMTLMEAGRGSYDGQVSQPIRECEGENTQFLMERLGELKSKGKELDLHFKKSGTLKNCYCVA
ncbi:SMC5-SMC6 complex localization factor protein 1 isoform X2 [Boleophthalmus pectinirostris]|nr:SMC5-SMC6 complex localization factor protein 1 isoform X2 [Boleophthalmus pectinirostris]XP_055017376.1 SMC5-SMC6 complex localization factor protein 1 isoform X2 [Boleophthalmus pectinirostris]XP_055017377.1 SMC5-SMC6 complex localization factor protein 1 isoform X2 [Boleophthalmus pectinirostris]